MDGVAVSGLSSSEIGELLMAGGGRAGQDPVGVICSLGVGVL